jgi:hypothetical protein
MDSDGVALALQAPARPRSGVGRGLHDALQGMLACKGHLAHHFDAGSGDVARVHATDAPAFVVYLEHDARGFFFVFSENALQYANDEFHGRVVIVKQHHLVERRRRKLGRLAVKNRIALVFEVSSHEKY